MKHILVIVGSNIRYYRVAMGLTQEQLACKSGLHRTYLGAVGRAERNISVNNVEKIAAELGVGVHVLFLPNQRLSDVAAGMPAEAAAATRDGLREKH